MANKLVDCSTFFVGENIFINVGLAPDFLFNCVVQINSKTQCVKMSIEFFKYLIPLLKNTNFSRPAHLYADEFKIISVVQCHAVHLLSIKCLLNDQCVQLSEENAAFLFEIKDAIQEMIERKNEIRPKVLLQACEICIFLGTQMPVPKNTNLKELEDYLKHIDPSTLSDCMPIREPCFIAQLMYHASSQLAKGWLGSSIVPEVIEIFYNFKY